MKKIIITLVFFISFLALAFALTPTTSVKAAISPKILTTSGPGEPTRLQAYSKATTDGANSLLDEDITGLFPEAYTGGAGIVPLDQNNNGNLNQFLIFAIDNGGPQARVMGLNADGSLSTLGQMFVFDDYIRDGLSATSGDFDGDGFQDDAAFCLTGDYNPRVKVFRDISGIDNWELINQFDAAFGANGCNLGTFQYDDGASELLVTPNHGIAEPKVWIYTVGGTLKEDFWAYDAPINQGLTAAGIEDRIFTTPNNGSSQVNAFDSQGERKNFWWVYEQHVRGDFTIRSAQLDPSTDKQELLISPIGSNGPHILGYKATGEQKPTPNFFAFNDPSLRNGVGIATIEDWHGSGSGGDGDEDDGDDGDNGTIPTNLIQPTDLEYKGAFRLPAGADGEDGPRSWSWSGLALTYYPSGDPSGPSDGYPGSLFATGHEQTQYIGEINIPRPVNSSSKSLSALNTASNMQNFVDIRSSATPGYVELGRVGLAYLPQQGSQSSDKIYFGWSQHFDDDDSNTHGMINLNLSSPNMQGMWRIDNKSAYSTSDYLFDIPSSWANTYVSGRKVATGRYRDGGWSGQGPQLYAYAPWSDGNPPSSGTQLSTTTLLEYDTSIERDDLYDDSARTMNGYHHSDEWTGASWMTKGNKAAVAFVGTKGVGSSYWYGDENGPCTECAGDRGWWSPQFQGRIIFYDPSDLADVAAGTMEPYEPQPYAYLNIDDYLYHVTGNQQKYHLGAAAFDRSNGILYIMEYLGDSDNNRPLVHVFKIN